MPFTQKAIDFLFENRLHDSRDWFREHKADYQQYVIEPLSELVLKAADVMHDIDPTMLCDPKKISRIYCDARYSKTAVFRDTVWYTFSRPRESAYDGHPGFYFSIGAGGISYGCGYYCATGAIKTAARELILADDPSFIAAEEAFSSQSRFQMYGDVYKRSKYPDQPAEKQLWLNRKEFGVCYDTNDPKEMFSPSLFDRVCEDYSTLAPLYDFYIRAEQRAYEQEIK